MISDEGFLFECLSYGVFPSKELVWYGLRGFASQIKIFAALFCINYLNFVSSSESQAKYCSINFLTLTKNYRNIFISFSFARSKDQK